jgi:hypothetical protein
MVALKQGKKSQMNSHKRNQSWSPEKGIYPVDVSSLALYAPSDTLLDQNIFFNLVRNSIYPCQIMCSTNIPVRKELQQHLGNQDKRSPNGVIKGILHYFQAYQECLVKIWFLLQNSLLVCEDGIVRGDENIGFSHPGFDSEVFQVASLSVISGWSMFNGSGSRDAFSISGWDGSMSASSIAKELMQTLPDINHLYETGQSTLAREITHDAVTRQLHNLIIAQYIRYNRIDLFSGKITKFSWNQAISTQRRGDRTKEAMKEKEKNTYYFNPSLELLHDNLSGKKETFSERTVAIWTQLNWLDAMRVIHQERLERLMDLQEKIIAELKDPNDDDDEDEEDDINASGTIDSVIRDNSARQYFLKNTKAKLDQEQDQLEQFLLVLPTHAKLIEDYHTFCNGSD